MPQEPSQPQDQASGDPQPTEQPDRQAMAVDHENPPKLAFPVVGIGASAGGLEAFTEFITAMRPDGGMAFVFIQHLPPERESMIADILAKKTKMLVQQVEEGMPIKPDCVYVIRPGHVLTMKDGTFRLGEPLGRRIAGRPVDDFFKSLAEEQRERGIGVILSGMGSNGTAGAQAIKAVGGLCIAQDPETAQFPSMPRHLIDQGYADYILRPSDIPDVLLQYAAHPYARETHKDAAEQVKRNENSVREILAILRTRTRQDFNGYKKPTVVRRIQRRMGLNRQTDMAEYAKMLRQSPSEVTALADDLLIHVTGFFRDHEAWEALRRLVIAPLIARREAESEIRAWVTACSSGEEAYSLAMTLVEEAEKANKPLGIKVFATDMADRPLNHARAGVYPGGIETEIDPERLEKFFEKDDGLYRVKPFVRECVVFAPQNVLSDPPFSRLDIISCRNLLIYLEPDVQQRVLSLLHFGLREGGALFLGGSETATSADDMFELIDKRARIYRRIGPTRHGAMDFPNSLRSVVAATNGGAGMPGSAAGAGVQQPPEPTGDIRDRRLTVGRPSIALITQRTLLERHVTAAVTIDRDFRVLYFHGNVRPFIAQPAGEPTRDLMQLAREGLRGSIRVAVQRARGEQRAVTILDGWLETSPGMQARVSVTASPVTHDDGGNSDFVVVSFEQFDETRSMERHRVPGGAGGAEGGGAEEAGAGDGNGDGNTATFEAYAELRRVKDELQSTVEALQTSNEDLKAANEEVTSINEELQSSNEELETSKEEMQSLNEELTTINAQLSAKIEEHQNASNDLSALLHSTSIAVLFLDPALRIRRYTPATRELMDLIPGDVGRPLSDMHRKFDDPSLEEDARLVLEKLVPQERDVAAENGRVFARRVLPYRTADNRIDGVVVTFVDVTRQRAEQEVVAAREFAESIVETLHEPLLVLNPDLSIRSANPTFFTHFKVRPADTIGRRIYDLGNRQWNIPELRIALEEILPQRKAFNDYEVRHDFQDLGHRVMLLNGRQLNHAQLILLGIRDVTVERTIEGQLRRSEERWKRMVNAGGAGVLTFDGDSGVLIDANDAFLQMTGYTRSDIEARKLTWQMMTPPEFIEQSRQQMEQLRKSGRIGPYEKQYFLKDGSRRWLLFAGADMGDGTIVEHCIDIDQIKRASLALHEAEAQLRGLVDALPAMVWASDVRGQHLFFNERSVDYLGRPQKDVIGRGWAPSIHPDDQQRAAEVWQEVARKGAAYQMEVRLRRASDGAYRWHLLRGVPVRDEKDQISRWFGTATDIHDQHTAIEELRAGEERFRVLVENVRDYAIFTADAAAKITSWNPGAQKTFKYTAEEIIGKDAAILFTPEDRVNDEHEKELQTAARDGRASDDRWQMRKGGERFWAAGVTTAVRDAAGQKVIGFIKILRDETPRKEMEDRLKAANEALEQRVASRTETLRAHQRQLRWLVAELGRSEIRQRRLLATELHDNLAQLLGVCRMRIASIEAKTPANTPVREEATVVKDALGEAINYTRGLMTDLRPDVLDEHDLPAAMEYVAKRMAAHQLKVNVTDDGKPKPIDEDLLGFLFQAVRELLWNVVKHARTTEATLTLERPDGSVRVIVEDRGVGFNPSKRKLLPSEEGGYGLFSIAERIDLLGGTMQVESAPRRGTRVILTAPLDVAGSGPTTDGLAAGQ